MRDGWNRATATLELTCRQLDQFIKPYLPNQNVIAAKLTEGGLANTNIQLRLSKSVEPLLLRILVRDPGEAQKELRLHQLIEGRVPAPRVFHFAPDNPVTGHPYMLMEWIEGVRLETLVRAMSVSDCRQLAQATGAALAAIHAVKFKQAGFLDGELNVASALEMGGAGLLDFTRRSLLEGRAGKRVGPEFSQTIIDFVSRQAGLLDQWDGAPCLTHCDFGGSNILVDDSSGAWVVSAVLDWEFALAGTPFFDFGNLLRRPLGAAPGFEAWLHAGYLEAGGVLPGQWREMSLLTDLTAWLDFLCRPEAGEQLIADARAVIEETIRHFEYIS